ncbi:MAG TPA: CPBP family intramembrane glutamic endopeptidase [Gammaproteobacteria bacterium]
MSAVRQKFGPLQGLWLVAGYVLAQISGYVLVGLVWGAGQGFEAALHHHKFPSHMGFSPQKEAWATLIGFTASAAWSIWYVRRRARASIGRGDAAGIAWRAPRLEGYGAAVGVALLAALFAAVAVVVMPPDPDKLTGPTSKLLDAPGLPRDVITALALVGAPLMEEFVFRGAFFAALAARWGALAAGIVTTLVFVALHAADKIHWWPGFVVVGFLGALLVLLRLRYQSIWPGMLAHFLYNASFFFLP